MVRATAVFFRGGSASISPRLGTVLGSGPSDPVAPPEDDPLEVNIIYLSDDSGVKIMLVSIDALYVGAWLRSYLYEEIQSLKQSQIFIAASHTHNAPMLDDSKPLLGEVNCEHRGYVAEQVANLAKRVLSSDPQEVSLRVCRYPARQMVPRRSKRLVHINGGRLEFQKSQMFPGRKLPPDVQALYIEITGDEKLLGATWIYPCHPTSFPKPDAVSAHFIGEIRERLRVWRAGGKKVPIVFFQGASGDLRPPAFEIPEFSWRWLIRRFLGRRFGNYDAASYELWVDSIWHELKRSMLDLPDLLQDNRPHKLSVCRSMHSLETLYLSRKPDPRSFSIHSVQLGNLVILGLSAEPTWDFSSTVLLRHECYLGNQIVLVGCIDDTFGYVASPNQLNDGGYEVDGFEKYFSIRRNSSERPQTQILNLTLKHLESAC